MGGEIELQVRNIPGTFRIAARSDLSRRILVTGEYEADVTRALQQFAHLSSTIVNVGANVGLFSCYFGKVYTRASRVIAIEPNPEAYRLLVENVKNSLLSKFDGFPCLNATS